MFLTQPPSAKIVVRRVNLNFYSEYRIQRLFPDITIEKPSGVTIRDLAMGVEQHLQQHVYPREWWYPVYAGILESGDDEADKADEERGDIAISR